MSVIKVGYWALRGRVEPIHMYLEYKDVPYEKIVYTKDNFQKWLLEDRYTLNIDFPNMPYLIDGDVKLTQTKCILKYLEGKYGSFYTGDLSHDIQLDTVLETMTDIHEPFGMMCYADGKKAQRAEKYLCPIVMFKWQCFDEMLQHRKYLTGDNLCVADFALWNLVDYHDLFDSKFLENHKNIRRFKKEFESEPKVDAFLKHPNYKKFPITGWVATWGGKDYAE